MYQIDNSTAAAVIPASTAAGTPGYFADGNPATGVPATILPAEFMNMLMMEVLGVLSSAGITPSKSNFTQLSSAIRVVNRQVVILTDTGIAGAYAAANTPALTAFPATGYVQWINIAHANPGAATYSPDGLAAKPIYGLGLQALQGGELPVGLACLRYLVQSGVNGGNGAWVIIESLGGASQVAPATQSQHAMQLGQAVGRLLGPPQVFGTPGTFPYTQTPGTNKIFLEVQGGCAASGGAPATGAGVSSLGGPGGAGAYASAFISAAFSGVTITVGAGGTGVSGSTGNNGGPSSFGALISAPGGIGGTAAGPSSSVFESTANNTAAPSGGNIKSTVGLRGTTTISLSPTALFLGNPGQGVLGGLGGTATGNTPSLAAKTGNPGDNGKVIVWEYA